MPPKPPKTHLGMPVLRLKGGYFVIAPTGHKLRLTYLGKKKKT